jgi:hypothetical protein
MAGGIITKNHAIMDSGGVGLLDNTTFTMNGGTISENTASDAAGGVYAYSGRFTMNGGTISGNKAKNGGGVFVFARGTFTMTLGTIEKNTATNNGGGVGVHEGSFTMTGGTISGNTASEYGGGVNIAVGNSFTKTGGTITGSNDIQAPNLAFQGKDNRGNAVNVDKIKYYVIALITSERRNWRDNTAGPGVNLDASKDGAAGGWINTI